MVVGQVGAGGVREIVEDVRWWGDSGWFKKQESFNGFVNLD